MTDSNTPNDDSYIDPTNLKEDEKRIDPAELIDTLKQSEGVRWPGALMLMGVTLVIGLGLGAMLLRNNDEPIVTIDGPEITLSEIDIPDIGLPEVGGDSVIESAPYYELSNKTVETIEGTFTEWFLYRGEDDLPNFWDYAWHPESDIIYLVAHDENIYWIGPERDKIEYRDISLRLGESLPWLQSVAILDEERLLLFMDHSDVPLVIYNVVTDRVEKRISDDSNTSGSRQINLLGDQGIIKGLNGKFYLINTYSVADADGGTAYADEIHIYDDTGEQLQVIQVDRGAESLTVDQNGHIFLIGGYGSLYEYDSEGNLIIEIERDLINYSTDMVVNREGQIYFVRSYDSWFIEIQPNREFGAISQPTLDFEVAKWDLGEVRSPLVMVKNPNAEEFLILDGDYDFKRLFLFTPK